MPDLNELSEREREILNLVAEGKSNKEIAQSLVISANTVKVHLRNIFAKLGVSSRTEAAMALQKLSQPAEAIAETVIDDAEQRREIEPDAVTMPEVAEPAHLPTSLPRSIWQQPILLVGAAVILVLAGLGLSQLVPGTDPAPAPIVESASFAESRWTPLANLDSDVHDAAVAVVENRVYVIGGSDGQGPVSTVISFDPEGGDFKSHPDKPIAVSAVQAVVIGGLVFVPGGFDPDGMAISALEVYDPVLERWDRGANLPEPLAAYATVAFEGKLYLFGGTDGAEQSNRVYSYLPESESWTELSPIPGVGRSYAGAAVSAGTIFVVGGFDGAGSLTDNLAYAPGSDRSGQQPWTTATDLPEGRYAMGTASVADIIHLIGGQSDSQGNFSQMEYSPQDDQWRVFGDPLAGTWSHMGVAQVETRLHVVGGLLDGSSSNRNMVYRALFVVAIPINP
jgi:DNA-binding CsgD family transcriptional regulator